MWAKQKAGTEREGESILGLKATTQIIDLPYWAFTLREHFRESSSPVTTLEAGPARLSSCRPIMRDSNMDGREYWMEGDEKAMAVRVQRWSGE